jgi:preprotein translocase subunit SecY
LSPQLAAIKKEGESGRKKLNQYTRYGTVLLTAVQGYFIAVGLESFGAAQGMQAVVEPGVMFRVTAVISAGRRHDVPDVAGRADHLAAGIGNGTSLIIMAGIVAQLPVTLANLFQSGREGSISGLLILGIIIVGLGLTRSSAIWSGRSAGC